MPNQFSYITTLTHESILSMGKYKGSRVGDILIEDPFYIRWIGEKVKNLRLSIEIIGELDERIAGAQEWDRQEEAESDND